MANKAYNLGIAKAFTKLGLLDSGSKRNRYSGAPRTTSMRGESATGNYDNLLATLRHATTDQAITETFDRRMNFDDNRTDLSPGIPNSENELEPN